MADHNNPKFGEAVKAVLAEHGLTLRGQRVRTGIDHSTMKNMCDGWPTTLERVEQFARAFHLDVNEWRELAGYPRVQADELSEEDQFELALGRGLRELARKYHRRRVTFRNFGGLEGLTLADVPRILAELEEDLQAEDSEP